MGRGRPARGPIAFMPSDGKFLGSKDMQGYPAGADGLRMPIRVVEVLEYQAGEVICGAKSPAFWAMVFECPPDAWLEAPWDAKPPASGWQRHRKEWKLGSEVVGRLSLRVGTDASLWPGAVIPLRLEVTSFGRKDVFCIRPVPLPWESDPQMRRQAMDKIAAGTYQPPGLPRQRPAERQSGAAEPDQPPPDDYDQRADEPQDQEPPDDWEGSVPAES